MRDGKERTISVAFMEMTEETTSQEIGLCRGTTRRSPRVDRTDAPL